MTPGWERRWPKRKAGEHHAIGGISSRRPTTTCGSVSISSSNRRSPWQSLIIHFHRRPGPWIERDGHDWSEGATDSHGEHARPTRRSQAAEHSRRLYSAYRQDNTMGLAKRTDRTAGHRRRIEDCKWNTVRSHGAPLIRRMRRRVPESSVRKPERCRRARGDACHCGPSSGWLLRDRARPHRHRGCDTE